MISKLGKQTVATHVFPNISRSNDNQMMKFGGQSVECYMGNIGQYV